VKGENAHPLYKYLTEQKKGMFGGTIKWNFTKFLVDKEGRLVERFAPITKPLNIEEKIKKLINS
jgi:glutathione peroxidase